MIQKQVRLLEDFFGYGNWLLTYLLWVMVMAVFLLAVTLVFGVFACRSLWLSESFVGSIGFGVLVPTWSVFWESWEYLLLSFILLYHSVS
jgi:hypothetical protein